MNKSENGVSKTCKITAIVCAILGSIGAAVLGDALGTVKHSFYGDIQKEFNIGVFFGVLFSVFIFCLTLYALGEIIDQLEMTRDAGKWQSQSLIKALKGEEQTTGADQGSPEG